MVRLVQISTSTCQGVIQCSLENSSHNSVNCEVLQCGLEPYLWNLLYLLYSEDKENHGNHYLFYSENAKCYLKNYHQYHKSWRVGVAVIME